MGWFGIILSQQVLFLKAGVALVVAKLFPFWKWSDRRRKVWRGRRPVCIIRVLYEETQRLHKSHEGRGSWLIRETQRLRPLKGGLYTSSKRGDAEVALNCFPFQNYQIEEGRPVYKFYRRRRRGCTSSKFKSLPPLDKYFLPHSHAHSAHWYLIFG